MTSQVDIYNLALQKVGDSPISSTSENSNKVRNLNASYKQCLQVVLSRGFWSFATEFADLSPSGDYTPEFEFSYAYEKPEKLLRLDDQYPRNKKYNYRIKGKYILSDQNPLSIRYIKLVEDTAMFPPMFIEALACYMAYYISPTTDKTKKNELYGIYNREVTLALFQDSGDDQIERDKDSTSWEDAFYG